MSMLYFTTKNIQTIIVSIANFCLAIGLCILIIQLANAQTSCDTYASESTPPQGFGTTWNVLSTAKELLIKSECNQTSAKVTAGSGSNNQFIYKTGYYYKDGWHPFTFQGISANGTNEWLVNSANYTFQGNSMPTGTLNWIAYICQWDSAADKWKCGCRDAACVQSFWQLQIIKKSSSPIIEQGTCTSDSQCPTGFSCWYDPRGMGIKGSQKFPGTCFDNNIINKMN